MQYQMLFDITQTGYRHWSELWIAPIFCLYLLIFGYFKNRLRMSATWKFTRFLVFAAIWGVLISLFAFYWHYSNYWRLQAALRQSQCLVTTGVVSQFHQLRHSSKRSPGESFVVNGLEFRYREDSVQNGFNQTGIIHNGQAVRISYLGDDIARLEIAR